MAQSHDCKLSFKRRIPARRVGVGGLVQLGGRVSTTVWAGQYNWVCPYLGLKNKPQGCDSNPSDPLSRVVDLTPSPHRSNLDAAHRAKKGAMS